MSNVKEEFNSSRRKRKGYRSCIKYILVLMRPLRTLTNVKADELIIENPAK